MSGPEKRTVTGDEAGIRLDRWFRRHYPDLPHGRLEQLLRKGQIRLDGARTRANARLAAGQSIRVPPLGAGRASPPRKIPPAAVSEADAAAIQATVLHRDATVIVLNKPPGLAVQGGTNTRRHLDAMLDALQFGAAERPRLVHSLDKDTSGCLVLARQAAAAAALGRAFRSRAVRKIYWGLVAGHPKPPRGQIDASLGKAAVGGREKMTPGTGRAALTLYRTLERAGPRAWLELEPRTGRTHQVRAHCAHLGTPILGDGKYGGRAAFPAISRLPQGLYLHARTIEFPHPDGGKLVVTAPPPAAMVEALRLLGFSAAD